MGITINIQADTATEAIEEMRVLIGKFTEVRPPTHPHPDDASPPKHPYPDGGVENPDMAKAPLSQPIEASPMPAFTEEPKKRTRRTKAEIEAAAQISSGEERVGPEDSPEVKAQDAADEKAEAEAKPTKEPTADDLRQAIGAYAKKFGVAECQADGVRIFTDALGTPPEGKAWGISVIGTDQARLAKAVAAWAKAGSGEARY